MRLPAPKADVIYRAVDGGAVLLAAEQEVYYGLNEVGSYIWEQLPLCQTLDELVAAVSRRYPEVAAETILTDTRELLEQLSANGLVNGTHPARQAHKAAP